MDKIRLVWLPSINKMFVDVQAPGIGVKATDGKVTLQIIDGYFKDYRWKDGRWDLALFQKDGKTNWDAVSPTFLCPCTVFLLLIFSPPRY